MKWQAIAATLLLTMSSGCTREVDEYLSALPEFAELKVENLSRNTGVIYVGDQLRVTAVQSKKGTLLHKAVYTWTFEPSKANKKEEVVYDRSNGNPTWTFTADSAANCTLQLTAVYSISGSGVARPSAQLEKPHGGQIDYTVNPLNSRAVLKRPLTVFSR